MIVPMKKAAIIVQSKDAEGAIKKLRSIGALHVENQQAPGGKDISSLGEDIATLDKVAGILSAPEMIGTSGLKSARALPDWRFAAQHVLDTSARIDHLEEYARTLTGSIAEWEGWGDFDPAGIAALASRGIRIKLYEMPSDELQGLPPDIVVRRIDAGKGMVRCALISRGEIDIPYKEIQPPKTGLNEMKARLAENAEIVRALHDTVRKHTCYLERFMRIRDAFRKELELHEALRGMGASGEIAYLVGYVPHDRVGALTAEVRRQKWGISVFEPSEEDMVPTFIRNPRWVSIISPIFRLIEIVPGYRELDISPVFLLALSLFFGMIIGDAGYGALYILLTFIAQRKLGKKMKDHKVFFLFYLFSASAVLWGLLTGTVFGQEWYLKAGMKPLVPILNDTKFLQAFCFFIGAVHLSIAQAWQGLRKLPSLTVLADAGWISVIWAAFFLARMLILGDALPVYTRWLIIGGVTLVVIGTSPQRNILKMIGSGLGNVALSIMNNFTDVVSYIRLFAVGLAGVAIADTVNTLAAEVGNPVAQALILFAGHTINILLGPLSVLVHGVRLNVLEFSGHVGLTWGGVRYKPLEE